MCEKKKSFTWLLILFPIHFFHVYKFYLVCPTWLTDFPFKWWTVHFKCSLWMLHREYTLCCMCYLSTLRAHRLSTVMPTDAFCRKGSSLHRKSPKKLLANGQPIARSCTTTQTHIHTLAGQRHSTRRRCVISGTLGYFSYCYHCNTQPPDWDTKHTLSLLPQQISAAAVKLLNPEISFPLLEVQYSEPYLVDIDWNVNGDIYQVSQGQTGNQSIGSIPHAFILTDNPEQGGISNDPHR